VYFFEHVAFVLCFTAVVARVTLSDSAPVPNFLNPDPGSDIFSKFENPTAVQTLAAIDPTKIYQCFYLRNDHAATTEIEK